MSGKHTPGPWRWNARNEFLVSERYGMVHSDDHRASRASARLIAAAPEMLEALREAESVLACSTFDVEALTTVRAAIAKATGEEVET